MVDASDANGRDGVTGEGGKQNPADGVTYGLAEAGLQGFELEDAFVLAGFLKEDLIGLLKIEEVHRYLVWGEENRRGKVSPSAGETWLLGVQFDDELFVQPLRNGAALRVGQELALHTIGVPLEPGILAGFGLIGGHIVLDELKSAGLATN